MMRGVMGMVALAMLAACGGEAPSSQQQRQANGDAAGKDAPVDDGMVECAIGGSGGWARDCGIERAGKMLTLRHPDGGFRRFRVLDDGRGLEAADGAEAVKLTILDDRRIEMLAGADRYRLPAQIGAAGR